MKKLDLFKLHSKKDKPLGWIWAKLDSTKLKQEYNILLQKSHQRELALKMNKELKAGRSTIEKHLINLKKSEGVLWIPLPIIIKITKFSKRKGLKKKLIKEIKLLGCKTAGEKIKPTSFLTKTLAKIIGAHSADGYLKKEHGSYRIKVCDGKKEIIEIFSKWIQEAFELKCIIRFSKRDNTWICWFNNKVIGRYFERIFEIPSGKKSRTIREPNLIKKSSLDIRKAFALGVLTFDGGVKATGMVSLTSKSKDLIKDINEILSKDQIKVKKSYNKKKDFYLIEAVSGRKENYLRKLKSYFEENSSKRKKLEIFIKPQPTSMTNLRELFPKHHNGKTNLNEIYNTIKNKEQFNSKEFIREFSINRKISETTIYKYLHILKQSSLIS